jgi:FtsP/CotA-like multicopper oxidase with cupredoxin domain
MAFDGEILHLTGMQRQARRQAAGDELAARRCAIAIAAAVLSVHAVPAAAQSLQPQATRPAVDCPTAGQQDFLNPPELVTSNGVLKGTIFLTEEAQRLPTSTGGKLSCAPQLVRNFRRGDASPDEAPLAPSPAQPPDPDLRDPEPGPTLRARVGDLVQLSFVNRIDPNRFDKGFDIEACTRVVGQDGNERYPGSTGDKFPNCLHASSTANLHFHGTHTNPNSTGDNVYLQVRPLPRDVEGQPLVQPRELTAEFEEFFRRCARELQNPLHSWPVTWDDMPRAWADRQADLLVAYQQKNPTQRLWDENQKVMKDNWPIYYIGAFPYCFALPAYTVTEKDDKGNILWPPPPGSTSPKMGQSPGTHWYHAHKHGSTAINVANGMTGAFIIEGKYDDDLNDPKTGYGSYIMKDGDAWSARTQPVLVLNELGTVPNLLAPGPAGVDFAVNGRIRPRLKMQPGEVQLWRIVNASGRSAAYFMAPEGLEWRQIAQDGVQFNDPNYQNSQNRPFYMAPANRVDLLVRAPASMNGKSAEIRVQNVMARSSVMPSPRAPSNTDPLPGVVLLTVDVTGPQVMEVVASTETPPTQLKPPELKPTEMPFRATAPEQPVFLKKIEDTELGESSFSGKRLVFDSAGQHTINGIQFDDEHAHLNVLLNAVEEWTIQNKAGGIDHPLHIHINPFQISEFFDPNEKLVDPATGKLEVKSDKTEAVPRYVTKPELLLDPNNAFAKRQCYLDPKNEATWSVTGARSLIEVNGVKSVSGPCTPQEPPESASIWHDVFAIPSSLSTDGAVIPGYFKMRSRFVDYPGLYVTHCHILIHEDRGMMFSVEVLKTRTAPVRHH